jgi:acyl-CoA thioesterase
VSGHDRVPPDLVSRLADDPWARSLGIEYLAIERGSCRLALTLKPDMVNFHGRPHGGVIFTIADTAFGVACNAHGEPAVGLSVTITYLGAAAPGSRLIAEGRQVKQGRRTGFYDVTVTTDDGTLVARAHCIAQRVGKPPSTSVDARTSPRPS